MRMTSRVRIRSSRANGALSRGPKTAAGKLRSAGNRCTHGFYSNRVVLKNESQLEFDALLQEYIAALHPQNYLELPAIHAMAAARWCLDRTRTIETRLLNEALRAVDPEGIRGPQSRFVAAWSKVIQLPGFLSLSRFAGVQENRFHRALKTLLEIRDHARKVLPQSPRTGESASKIKNATQNPLYENFITGQPPVKSAACGKKQAADPHPAAGANISFSCTNAPKQSPSRTILTTPANPFPVGG
jgi:hypothetical protein